MKIALDAMGGDHAPKAILEGAVQARMELHSNEIIILVGVQDQIVSGLQSLGANPDHFPIVHTSEVIEMGEHATQAIKTKQDSSIVKGVGMVAMGKADVFASAGNTGAAMVASVFILKPIEGVLRPGIAGFLPKAKGGYGITLDVGANAECKPEVLAQFAEIGSIVSKHLYNINTPKVGIMSLGTEEGKGTTNTQAAYTLIKENNKVNFVGNIEGRNVFDDTVDVIICDGFTGNVMLKMGESIYPYLKQRNFVDDFVELFNWENVGGSPIVGINGNVIIGHGASNAKAIKNMIKLSLQWAKSDITNKLKTELIQN
ncbi:MAG: phosphate acyltransferase PlsX [Cytophagales bacterium]|nr:phosphate acyltransferase PlsX [Cytophagales bacterium]